MYFSVECNFDKSNGSFLHLNMYFGSSQMEVGGAGLDFREDWTVMLLRERS